MINIDFGEGPIKLSRQGQVHWHNLYAKEGEDMNALCDNMPCEEAAADEAPVTCDTCEAKALDIMIAIGAF